jgi:hypothetical protein
MEREPSNQSMEIPSTPNSPVFSISGKKGTYIIPTANTESFKQFMLDALSSDAVFCDQIRALLFNSLMPDPPLLGTSSEPGRPGARISNSSSHESLSKEQLHLHPTSPTQALTQAKNSTKTAPKLPQKFPLSSSTDNATEISHKEKQVRVADIQKDAFEKVSKNVDWSQRRAVRASVQSFSAVRNSEMNRSSPVLVPQANSKIQEAYQQLLQSNQNEEKILEQKEKDVMRKSDFSEILNSFRQVQAQNAHNQSYATLPRVNLHL